MRGAFAALFAFATLGLSSAAKGAEAPADPWPRQFKSGNATILVYQPQLESWTGNVINFRCAIAITKGDSKDDVFGVIWAKARTQVDMVSRIVSLDDLAVTRRDFPTLADNGILYLFALRTQLGPGQRTVSLDRLQASLAASGSVKPQGIPVNNDPPRIIVSNSPAALVPIDGPPALRPVPNTSFQRVINTRALILAEQGASTFYLHVYDGWLFAETLAGAWSKPTVLPENLDAVGKQVAATGVVDMLEVGNANPKPSLESAVPAIFVSETPAELIVFQGEPAFTPVAGTSLAWASNTAADVFLDSASNRYLVLLAGRWFAGPALIGPWTFVPSTNLPADFKKIPVNSPAGVVLAAVAGTPQAEEALIANSIPQTATVKRAGGPMFAPRVDGTPQFSPVTSTPLQYVVNSPTPIIQVNPSDYYALKAGLWFTAPALSGPWTVAASVPAVIYTIPPSSPLHYVTYVQIYGATLAVVYEGYTPGYLGTVATPEGVVVYGTGYTDQPWIGSAWYPPPATYTVAAQPVDNPAAGMAFAFAMGVTTAALTGPSAYYHPYPFPTPYYHPYPYSAPSYHPYGAAYGTTSASVYGHYGDTATYGTRSYYSHNDGGPGDRARGDTDSSETGRYSHGSSASTATSASTGEARTTDSAAAAGPGVSAAARPTRYTNPKTGQSSTYGAAKVGNDVYADKSGQVYSNAGGGWQQHSSSGWSSASGDTSWADREAQARSAGEDRFNSFSQGAGHSDSSGWASRVGGSDGGSPRPSGGGAGWGDRYGESGGLRR